MVNTPWPSRWTERSENFPAICGTLQKKKISRTETLRFQVFSWGEGEDGKLGHGNRLSLDRPRMIEALRSKRIRDIACGSSHSAAISSNGELYTWGLGEYGRLGHGDNLTQLRPKLVLISFIRPCRTWRLINVCLCLNAGESPAGSPHRSGGVRK